MDGSDNDNIPGEGGDGSDNGNIPGEGGDDSEGGNIPGEGDDGSQARNIPEGNSEGERSISYQVSQDDTTNCRCCGGGWDCCRCSAKCPGDASYKYVDSGTAVHAKCCICGASHPSHGCTGCNCTYCPEDYKKNLLEDHLEDENPEGANSTNENTETSTSNEATKGSSKTEKRLLDYETSESPESKRTK
jgi:hypothetical protein